MVGGRGQWKERVIDYLGEGDRKEERSHFLHDVWYDKKETIQKPSLVFDIEIQGKRNIRFSFVN